MKTIKRCEAVLRGTVLAVAMGACSVAGAIPIAEVGDAGDTLGSQQIIGGGATSISGALSFGAGDYFDLFQVSFNSAVTLTMSAVFDSELAVMDLSGFGVASDDDSGPGFNAAVSLAAGSYLVGVSTNSTGLLDGGAAWILFNNSSTNQGSFSGFGPLTGTSDLGFGDESGSYTLNFSTASASVSEPGIAAMLMLGLVAAGSHRKLRRRAS